jgi:CDP-L-myo-inositol myo-inositolphosphotransferase
MADHIVDSTIVGKAVNQYGCDHLLCVDENPSLLGTVDEATKVYVDKEGLIKEIGKEIHEWNGIDTGIFHLNTNFFNLFNAECKLSKVSECMRRLINQSSLAACNVTGFPWIDVDTKFDLIKAEKVLKEWV